MYLKYLVFLIVYSAFVSPELAFASDLITIKDCEGCPELRFINGGEYTAGVTSSEQYHRRTAHKDIFINAYYLGTHEVTISEYYECVDAGACDRPDVGSDTIRQAKQPVMAVSWQDAVSYTRFLTEITGRAYRLPSEMEWEFAASAGSTTRYWWGNKASLDFMNYNEAPKGGLLKPSDTNWGEPANVASFPANPLGLFDMNGNVAEWVADCRDSQQAAGTAKEVLNLYPEDASPVSPIEGKTCGMRAVKGGSYLNAAYYARNRFPFEFFDGNTDVSAVGLGFRVATDKP